mgnify:CR=1 FL=1
MFSTKSQSFLFGLAILFATCHTISAQPFLIRDASAAPLSFKEMQQRFGAWAKSHDLKKEKGWKYYKRWEHEMLMHTDGQGVPADPEAYMKEVLKATKEKQHFGSSRFSSTGWLPSGPNVLPNNLTGYMENGMGRINCMAFHPSDANTFFIGVAQGGVWKTTNGGNSWTPLTDQLPILRISDICIDPVNPQTIYIAVGDFEYIGTNLMTNGKKRNTHYGLGVYKTTDGGVTWAPTGLSLQLTQGDASLIRKIIVHPVNTNQLVACGSNGLFVSSNGGATWTTKSDSLFWDLTQDPSNPNVLYAATGWVSSINEGSAGIYKSTDFGMTWNLLNTGIPPRGQVQRIRIEVSPADPNYVYAMAVSTSQGLYGFYKSTDAGATWNFINGAVNVLGYGDGSNNGGQGSYDLGLCLSDTNRNILYTGGVNVWTSSDGAQTFSGVSDWTLNFGPTIHGDIHFITRQPLTGAIFVCNDGGIYRTTSVIGQSWADAQNGTPWPTQWTKLNDGFQITSFYRISSSRNATGRLIGGAQDNASFYFNGTTWSTVFGGDGMDNFLDPLNDQRLIGSSQFGNFYESLDDGLTNSAWNSNPANEPEEWTTPIVADYNHPGTFYIGNSNVYQSTDDGVTFNQIGSLPTSFVNNEISALAVANSNSDVLVAAKRVRYEFGVNGSVFITNNGGISWSNITAGLPDSLYYTSVDINQADENTIYIAMAGFVSGQKVYRSTDGGNTWQNISYNLPNLPVNCIKNLPGTNDLLAATDIGVYLFDNSQNTWSLMSTNLPNVIVSDIEFNVPLNKIYIGTFGRGIWESSLSQVITSSQPVKNNLIAQLYPTVNNGAFTINIPSAQNQLFDLEVIDIKGALVYTSRINGNETKVSLKVLPGKYFARLHGATTGAMVQSFIVE